MEFIIEYWICIKVLWIKIGDTDEWICNDCENVNKAINNVICEIYMNRGIGIEM